MFLFASHFLINHFYYISDEISDILENNRVSQEMKSHPNAIARCLFYMSHVLIDGIYQEDKQKIKILKNDYNDNNVFEKFKKMLKRIEDFFIVCEAYELITEENKDEIIYLIRNKFKFDDKNGINEFNFTFKS